MEIEMAEQNEMMELAPDEMGKFLAFAFKMNKPVFIWGPPGVGKTQLVRQLAEHEDVDYVPLHLTLMEPVDMRGLPVVNADHTGVNWVPMGELPQDPRSMGVIHLDELNTADPSVMAAAMQFVLERRIGTYTLPKGWRIVACGNRVADGAAARRMPTALADRFSHATLEVSVEAWTDWAIKAGMQESIIGFINYRKDMLWNFNPTRTVNTTPRGWEDVDAALRHDPKLNDAATLAYCSGRVGLGPITELRAFNQIYRDLPDIDKILDGRTTEPKPGMNAAVKYAVAVALALNVKSGQAGNMLDYLDKIGPEFSKMAVFMAIKRSPAIARDSTYQDWVTHRMERFG